jgi:hypothetical protein
MTQLSEVHLAGSAEIWLDFVVRKAMKEPRMGGGFGLSSDAKLSDERGSIA